MPDPRLDNGEEVDEEEEDEEVSDNPLPAWLEGDSLAPPCQADMDVVRAIVDFAGVTEDDVLYDLGCGDGRICIEAAESRGAKACGVEIEEDLADKFRRRVAAKGLESKVTVVHGDLRDVDLSDATVLIMYLLPAAMGDIAQSHLIPFLRRGRCNAPPRGKTSLAGHEETPHHCGSPPRETTYLPGDRKTPHDCDSSAIISGEGVAQGGEGSAGDKGRPQGNKTLAGDEETLHRCDSSAVTLEGKMEEGVGGGSAGDLGQPSGEAKPFRIVCNTWGIPGATAVREAGVGMYGGVKLRLFTHESLPPEDAV